MNNRIVTQIVGRCHVYDDFGTVRRYLLSRLENGFNSWSTVPRGVRRSILKQVHTEHLANRRFYETVMAGGLAR